MLIITLIIRIRTAISYVWVFRPGSKPFYVWIWNDRGQEIPPWAPEYSELVHDSIYVGLYGQHERKVMKWRIWKWLHVLPKIEDDKQLEFDF